MTVSPRAGKPPAPGMLVNVPRLITAYYADVPDPSVPALASALEVLAANGVDVIAQVHEEWSKSSPFLRFAIVRR
jgi:hypothetical protein